MKTPLILIKWGFLRVNSINNLYHTGLFKSLKCILRTKDNRAILKFFEVMLLNLSIPLDYIWHKNSSHQPASIKFGMTSIINLLHTEIYYGVTSLLTDSIKTVLKTSFLLFEGRESTRIIQQLSSFELHLSKSLWIPFSLWAREIVLKILTHIYSL